MSRKRKKGYKISKKKKSRSEFDLNKRGKKRVKGAGSLHYKSKTFLLAELKTTTCPVNKRAIQAVLDGRKGSRSIDKEYCYEDLRYVKSKNLYKMLPGSPKATRELIKRILQERKAWAKAKETK